MKIVHETILVNNVDDKERKEIIEPLRKQIIEAIKSLRMPENADGFYFNPDSKSYFEDGKKKGGNGVKPIKNPFIDKLKSYGWKSEFPSSASENKISKIKVLKNFGKSTSLIYGKVVSVNRDEQIIVYTNRDGIKQSYPVTIDFEAPVKDEELVGKTVSMEISKPGALDACINVADKLFVVEWETGNVSSSHRALNKMAVLLLDGHITGGVLIVPTRKMYPYLTDRIGNYEELVPYFNLWRNVNIEKGFLEIISIEHDGLRDDAPIIKKGKDGNAKKPVVVDPSNGSGKFMIASQMELLPDENK
ncbi:hypothetical protein ACRV5I_00090 [Bacillus halotolerans]|uniref:hypothetical protein n=1 Tax=Bacillus halotolerans TaxID=260554 RepID=UPI003EB9784D